MPVLDIFPLNLHRSGLQPLTQVAVTAPTTHFRQPQSNGLWGSVLGAADWKKIKINKIKQEQLGIFMDFPWIWTCSNIITSLGFLKTSGFSGMMLMSFGICWNSCGYEHEGKGTQLCWINRCIFDLHKLKIWAELSAGSWPKEIYLYTVFYI